MDIFDLLPENGLKFNHRGTPLDPELRPLWRISLLILILSKLCSGGKANSKKLQALYSLISSDKKRKAYPRSGEGKDSNASINIRFDPLVDRAVDMGIGYGFFELDDSKSVCLTQKGKNFGKKIEADTNLFVVENNYMKNFTKSHFTDQVISSLIAGDLL
ncbi:hypothetical protein [Shewanella baltica]|uniref:hypothetical protein n=1 Tax=Shewanella baltica TaxID=62322 RepID=UPI00217D3852|nr:hypothetical protein [Shewanella baltica]MCS6123992.1 hypothetical protein [Shewanella baltica]